MSNSDVVVTLQQWSKIEAAKFGDIKTQINVLEEKYDEKFEELDSRNSDLEQGLDSVRKDLIKVTQCTEEYTQLKDNLQTITTKITECAEEHTQLKDNNLKTITEKYTQLKSELESTVTTELKKHESTLEKRFEDLQEQFEGKNKKLNSKYEKFLGASINSKRQGSYASISFVLSGTFAVGASLTMFHLAMCLSLAVAALIFLAAGCYCLHKANTTLSNVEIDQTTNLVVV
ncbi:MAG: hypothetical protein ACEY3L_05550 [Wolbachia sp.]